MVRMKDEIAAVLEEYADLLAIAGGDAFRVRTHEKAARSAGGYPEDISQMDEAGLRQIPSVGASIAGCYAQKADRRLPVTRLVSRSG